MARAMLSTWPRTIWLVAHQLDARPGRRRGSAEIGLLEIAVDPERVGVDERDLVLPDIGVVAELRQ